MRTYKATIKSALGYNNLLIQAKTEIEAIKIASYGGSILIAITEINVNNLQRIK